jgi:hypothetical protein
MIRAMAAAVALVLAAPAQENVPELTDEQLRKGAGLYR